MQLSHRLDVTEGLHTHWPDLGLHSAMFPTTPARWQSQSVTHTFINYIHNIIKALVIIIWGANYSYWVMIILCDQCRDILNGHCFKTKGPIDFSIDLRSEIKVWTTNVESFYQIHQVFLELESGNNLSLIHIHKQTTFFISKVEFPYCLIQFSAMF